MDISKELSEEDHRKKLFDQFELMANKIEELKFVIQNPMKYTIKQKEDWVKMVTEIGQDMRKLNSKTLHYIEDNIE